MSTSNLSRQTNLNTVIYGYKGAIIFISFVLFDWSSRLVEQNVMTCVLLFAGKKETAVIMRVNTKEYM